MSNNAPLRFVFVPATTTAMTVWSTSMVECGGYFHYPFCSRRFRQNAIVKCQVHHHTNNRQPTTTNSFTTTTTTTSFIGFGLVRTIVQIHPFVMICIFLFSIVVTVIWIIDFIIIIIVGRYCQLSSLSLLSSSSSSSSRRPRRQNDRPLSITSAPMSMVE